jgi:hypothetical protein
VKVGGTVAARTWLSCSAVVAEQQRKFDYSVVPPSWTLGVVGIWGGVAVVIVVAERAGRRGAARKGSHDTICIFTSM